MVLIFIQFLFREISSLYSGSDFSEAIYYQTELKISITGVLMLRSERITHWFNQSPKIRRAQ